MSEELNRWLSKLYRASAQEQPPHAVDEVILRAARKEARRPPLFFNWTAPLALAAVVVIAVSLVIAMRDDLTYTASTPKQASVSEKQAVPRAQPGALSKEEPAPASKADQALSDAFLRKDAPADERPRSETEAKRSVETRADVVREEKAPQPSPQRFSNRSERSEMTASQQTMPAAIPETAEQPASAASAPAPKPLARSSAEESASGRQLSKAAEVSEQGSPSQGSLAAGVRRPQSRAAAEISPEAWLEKIAKLRTEGRVREADESLAEFRKRFPDYPLPASLK